MPLPLRCSGLARLLHTLVGVTDKLCQVPAGTGEKHLVCRLPLAVRDAQHQSPSSRELLREGAGTGPAR